MDKITIAIIASLWVIFFVALYLSKKEPKKKLLNLKPKKSNVYVMNTEKPLAEKSDEDIKIFQGFKETKEEDKLSSYKVIIPKRDIELESKSNVLNVSKDIFINKDLKKAKSKNKRKRQNDSTIKIEY